MNLILHLVRQNVPHLLGIVVYGLIGIALALLCYKLFTAFFIPLKSGMDFTPQESLAAVILAVGIVIGMSIIVAVAAYEPAVSYLAAPMTPAVASLSSSGGGCGTSHKSVAKAALKEEQAASIHRE